MPISDETRRNRRRRDVIALVIHDVHCKEGCSASEHIEGVDQDDLDRAANLIEALDAIDAEMGYAPTCSICGVTVYWDVEQVSGPVHTNLDAAFRAGPGPHAVKLAGSAPTEARPDPNHACAAHDDAHLGQPCPGDDWRPVDTRPNGSGVDR